jgi:hypothetical protein
MTHDEYEEDTHKSKRNKMTTTFEAAEAQLKANNMNMMQINVMWQFGQKMRSHTLYMRDQSLCSLTAIALRQMEDVKRIDILSPMGELIEEWSRSE